MYIKILNYVFFILVKIYNNNFNMNFILLINHPNEKDNKKSIIEIYIEKINIMSKNILNLRKV